MKSAVIALLLGNLSAIKLNDAPPYFNEPTWNEEHQSAAGFLQVSACVNANQAGVTCSPANSQLFATGMNGDEFHYAQKMAQWNPVVVPTTGTLPECHGNN